MLENNTNYWNILLPTTRKKKGLINATSNNATSNNATSTNNTSSETINKCLITIN